MIKNTFIYFGLIALITVACNDNKVNKKVLVTKKKPNIVLILADDMGFSDLGSYGSDIETPNIDRLAAEGTRLRRFYNNTICAPSRASLLTGQYPHKAGIGFFNEDFGLPGYEGYLNKESLTLAEVFKNGGYSTYMTGKWHVGDEKPHWPLQRGFDEFFGFLDGGASYFDTKPLLKGPPSTAYLYEGNEVYNIDKKDFYLTDELTNRAFEFIKSTPEEKPFFLYMAYNAPHWPLHAKPTDIAKYKGKYDAGWDELRKLRFENIKKLGLANEDWNLFKDKLLPSWDSLDAEEKRQWTLKMEVYAAMVDNLDQNIGKLLDYLESNQQLDNTVIVFLSDNGAENMDVGKMPFTVKRNEGPVGTAGSMEAYTKNWAQVSNSPLRSYKSSPYEGGTATPFIIRYPNLKESGKILKGGNHVVDIMPTLLNIAQVDYPKIYNGTQTNKLPGESFLPLLEGENWDRDQPICFEWFGDRAVWLGDLKAVSLYPGNTWELYDLATDRTESKNIAASQPETIAKVDAIYNEWAKTNGVIAWSEEMGKKTQFRKSPH
ncbi:arylsulfatase [Flavobacteriaceae bacterium]|nr:arylsulfatase [Flavobacteriaceae bacterium]MDB2329007.1 arylsulfatase [Flavobacteriaceae bacterium]MDB2345307.1 arylsulfatase [Flavobacteriaceae bacterium]MDB4674625.1 arylsulfatase [Flavobacteriaceae bacterium]